MEKDVNEEEDATHPELCLVEPVHLALDHEVPGIPAGQNHLEALPLGTLTELVHLIDAKLGP